MRVLPIIAAIAATAIATPATATETDAACWHYGQEVGIFDWQFAPSTACRAGQRADGTPSRNTASRLRASTAQQTAGSASGASRTVFEFSGSAYLGVAASF